MKRYLLDPDKWAEFLSSEPETGMGYQVATIKLRDGRIYDRVVIEGGYVTKVKGLSEIPFDTDEIDDIEVTHDKWKFQEDRNEKKE